MPTQAKRISVTIPKDLEERLDSLKQEKFYNTSYGEMLRQLILEGLQKSNIKTVEDIDISN